MKQLIRILLFLTVGFTIGTTYTWFNYPDFLDNYFASNQINQNNPSIENNDFRLLLSDSISRSRQNAITNAIQKVYPSVVGINVKSVQRYISNDPFDRIFGRQFRDYVASSVGSGFVISKDGYIITNQHVIENANEIIVTFPDGRKYDATKIGQDAQSDIALIKINAPDREFTPIPFGDSDDIIIGEWAIALGNPFGLNEYNNSPTVTLGIISAVNRDFGHIEGDEKVYRNMIQTDAAINSGNSGGPLVNALGQVIGMNTFIYTGSTNNKGSVGIAFSIPINHILRTVQLLKQGDIDREYYIGIVRIINNNQEIAQYLKLPIYSGAVIYSINTNSVAYRAGIRQGDVVIEANSFTIKSTKDYQEAIYYSGLKVGDKLNLKVLRQDKELSFTIDLVKR